MKRYLSSHDFVYIEDVGDNDMLTKSEEKFIEQVNCLLYVMEKYLPSTNIVLLSVKPSPSRKHLFDKYIKINKKLSLIANKNSLVDFVNIWDILLIDG